MVSLCRMVIAFQLFMLFASVHATLAATDCTFTPIDSGYGANGSFEVVRDSLANPASKRRPVYVFRPKGLEKPVPVIFFAHDFGSTEPEEYEGLISHLVSRGQIVVFPPILPVTFTRDQLLKQEMAYAGFEEACRKFSAVIDTTRIGFVGHGFGGGALCSVARKIMTEQGWGATGAYLYLMTPWYAYWVDQREMATFPEHAKMIVQVYFDSDRNSPQIALDIFRNMGISASEKEFLIAYSDSRGFCRLRANHLAPLSHAGFGGEDDPVDWYGIHRMIDALADCAFAGSAAGREVALGAGQARECDMGRWPDGLPIRRMVATDDPEPYLRKGIYLNPWVGPRNPRVEVTEFRRARKVKVRSSAKKVEAPAKQGVKKVRASLEDRTDLEEIANPITEGFGAPGPMSVLADSFPSPLNKGAFVNVFRPADTPERVPVVFLFHGYGTTHPNELRNLIDHLASRGQAVVYSPYSLLPVADDEKTVGQKHDMIYSGIAAAVKRYGKYFDTTRVGFLGHSFGAGAIPRVAYRCIKENRWGTEGAWMFLSAPWYTFGITPKQYANFPSHVKLIVQVYDDDRTNDHQMAVDIFNAIGIDPSEKDYMTLYTDSSDGYVMTANHFVPYGNGSINGEENLLDYYGVLKPVDALAEYAYTGSGAARNVALGNGSPEQRYMGVWPDGHTVRLMDVTDEPHAYHPELDYLFAWDYQTNPRREKVTGGEPEPRATPAESPGRGTTRK